MKMGDFETEGMDISLESEAMYFSAMHMFVAALGRCTFAVLEDYSMRIDAETEDITIELSWEYASKPTRISHITMLIHWSELPDSRIKAVQRAAHLCTLHSTLHGCVEIETKVRNDLDL
jgi:uncharacterized OsmC-like protein